MEVYAALDWVQNVEYGETAWDKQRTQNRHFHTAMNNCRILGPVVQRQIYDQGFRV